MLLIENPKRYNRNRSSCRKDTLTLPPVEPTAVIYREHPGLHVSGAGARMGEGGLGGGSDDVAAAP